MHAAAGGVGSLAVQLGQPFGAGRVIATASTEEKRALALELGADAAVDVDARGPRRRADRGQRRRAASTSCSRWPAAACSTQSLKRAGAVRAARHLRDRLARAERASRTGALMRRSTRSIGFWLMHCLGAPAEMVAAPLHDLFERVARGELRVVEGADLRAVGGPARARGPAGAPHDRQARCSTRRAEQRCGASGPASVARTSCENDRRAAPSPRRRIHACAEPLPAAVLDRDRRDAVAGAANVISTSVASAASWRRCHGRRAGSAAPRRPRGPTRALAAGRPLEDPAAGARLDHDGLGLARDGVRGRPPQRRPLRPHRPGVLGRAADRELD